MRKWDSIKGAFNALRKIQQKFFHGSIELTIEERLLEPEPHPNTTGVLIRRGDKNKTTQREDLMETEGREDRHPQAKRGVKIDQPCRHLDLRLSTSRIMTKHHPALTTNKLGKRTM